MQKMMQKEARCTLVGILVSVFIVGVIIVFFFSTQYRNVLIQRKDKVVKIANEIDRHVNGRILSLKVLASGLITHNKLDAVKQYLDCGNGNLNLVGLGVYSVSGNLHIKTSNYSENLSETEKKNFAKVFAGEELIVNSKGDSKYGSNYVKYFVPIYNQYNNVDKILVAEESAVGISRSVEKVFTAQNDQYIYVVDNNGELIYHPQYGKVYGARYDGRKAKEIFNEDRVGTIVTNSLVGGYDKAYTYAAVENANWRVVMATPIYFLYWQVVSESSLQITVGILFFMLIGSIIRSRTLMWRHRQELEHERFDRLSCVNQLSAVFAHEIRNPLTCIKGFLQLIEKKIEQPVSPHYVTIMLDELQRIDSLINEFRSIAKPVQHYSLQVFNFTCMLQDIIILLESHAASKQITLNYSLQKDVFIKGNLSQIKQVVINLIKNAIEAEKFGGKINIELIIKNENVEFVVRDKGSGIPFDVLKNIGRPFYSTKNGGTGLGLSVCISIVQRHGGTIRLGSLAGYGTTVSMILPVVKATDV